MAKFTEGQWPHNICSGDIRYARASNYDGFYIADASHGIPTFGSVCDTPTPTISGQHVCVFNYPGQTEAIARQLCLRWNAYQAMLAALNTANGAICAMVNQIERMRGMFDDEDGAIAGALDDADQAFVAIEAAIAKAEGRSDG